MQYQSPRYEGDIGKAYGQLVACRSDVRASLSTEALRDAYVHFFGDLQRRTEVSLVSRVRSRVSCLPAVCLDLILHGSSGGQYSVPVPEGFE